MTVATRSSQRAGEAGLEPQSPLAQASFAVDEHPERFVELVRAASVEELKPVAPRLLELLSSKTFGLQQLDDGTPRQVTVQAVLRAGYPWALELEPEDVSFVREQVASARSARRRALLRRSVPLALAAVGVAFVVNGFVRVVAARSSENPVAVQTRSVTLYPPRHRPASQPAQSLTGVELPVATVAELVPDADRALLLEASMDQLVARGHDTEALTVGLDCLAVTGVDDRRCATALIKVLGGIALRERADGRGTSDARQLSDTLFLFSEAPRAHAVRHSTRETIAELRLLAKDGASLTGTSESMARDAKARFARGEFASALNLAERCVASFPADLECLSVAATALPLVNAARQAADRAAREAAVAESFEGYRRQMARVLAHAARERCEAAPPGTDESRPIACP